MIYNIKDNIYNLILEYLDSKTLLYSINFLSKKHYNFSFNYNNYISSLDHKLFILNNLKSLNNKNNYLKFNDYLYNLNNSVDNIDIVDNNIIIYEQCDILTYHNNILKLLDNNIYIFNFLINLLKTDIFYIGGSFALLLSHLIFNIHYDIEKYYDSDIDIYVISNTSIYNIQTILNELLIKYINNNDIRCLINIKKHLINIEFFDNNIRKIQIILHIKHSIDEYIYFIDLPISQFILGKDSIYFTKLAYFTV